MPRRRIVSLPPERPPTSPQDPASPPPPDAVRAWFDRTFADGPTPAQSLAWPRIAARESLLLVSPTGTGKTLAAFLAILDRLFREAAEGKLGDGLRCLYVSPLKSLGYDIERNLTEPLEAIRRDLGLSQSPVRLGVRTGDTSQYARTKLRERPPHLLITTPESLSLMLSQPSWNDHWKTVDHVIVDEIHSLVPTKRGADLMISIERVAAQSAKDPARVGLSATCRSTTEISRFLVGPDRPCHVIQAPVPPGEASSQIEIDALIQRGEAPHRGLSYRRLLKRLRKQIGENRTTVIFANTRAFTEKITHDLKSSLESGPDSIAAHHSALDSSRRREVESHLKAGDLRAVVTSTSLELGVDIGTADLTAMIGLPGSTSRCLQRLGRAGHRVCAVTRGVILASTAAEIAGAAVTADAARQGLVEPIRPIAAPLDVLCQQIIGMACLGEQTCDDVYSLVKSTACFESLTREDFDACLSFLSGDLAAPPGAFEPTPGAAPKGTAPRIWKSRGRFGIQSRRVIRWFRSNVGTISSEESVRVKVGDREIGSLEGAYADRLQPGDRFVLDGRSLRFLRIDGLTVHAEASAGEPDLPRWSSDRQSLSAPLARSLAEFRERAAILLADDPSTLRAWLVDHHGLEPDAAGVLEDLFAAQEQVSQLPPAGGMLLETSPGLEGRDHVFHVPLARSACEALSRAVAARLGRRYGRDLTITVADLGFAVRLPDDAQIREADLPALFDPAGFTDDILEGLDRGELLARRFRHVAGTAMMVLRRPEGGRTRVGGLLWVSNRLYPMVKASSPDHPLLRETRREVLDDLLDTRSAVQWLTSSPALRVRHLDGLSPFGAAWIDPAGTEALRFESPAESLRRLHARLVGPDRSALS